MSSAAPRQVVSLPAEMTSFVDRRAELSETKRLLASSRLLTLTGAGGVGKSRLALRLAASLRRAVTHGVWLVELAGLRDEALLAHTVAHALGIRDYSARPAVEVLVDHLRDRRVLVVLDNCEHLLEGCAVLVARLLREAPGLRVLATSRSTLDVTGEQVFAVSPLGMPEVERPLPADAATRYPSLVLFSERAAAAQPDFAVTADNRREVAELCHRLDGIPLAIELAAARLRVLSLQGILERLDDRYRLLTTGAPGALPRHQTLRAAVEWSHALCSPAEQRLWARASVFADSFDLAAAEAVCSGDGLARSEILDTLAGLVDKSILTRAGNSDGTALRFCLLDTLRDFGLEKLREAGAEPVLRLRHRDHYLDMVERDAAAWFGPSQPEIFARTRREHANLRIALEFCLTTPGQVQAGLHMAGTLHHYWVCCGFRSEGRHWLDRALALDTEPTPARVIALRVNAECAVSQGDQAAMNRLAEQARAAARQQHDESLLGHTAYAQGVVAILNEEPQRAEQLLEEAWTRLVAHGELNSITVMARVVLALAAISSKDLSRAVAIEREAIAIAEEHGELWTRSYALYFLAMGEWARGDLADATAHAREGLRLKRIFNDLVGQAMTVELLAWITAADESERGAVLLGAADTIWRAAGCQPLLGSQDWIAPHQACEAQLRRDLGDHAFRTAFTRGRELDLDQTAAYALGTTPPEATTPATAAAAPPLTAREHQVAALIAQGMSNHQIADRLVIAQRTAEAHVQHILQKLGFTSRSQIAAWIATTNDHPG